MKTVFPKIEIEKLSFNESRFSRGNKCWLATTLYKAAEEQKLETFDYPLAAFDMLGSAFETKSLDQFIYHCQRVKNTDTCHPIIFDDYGQIADGYHRCIKAILEGKTSIKAYRLKTMPDYDWEEKDNTSK